MRSEIIEKLQQEILSMQGLGVPTGLPPVRLGLGPLEAAMPNKTFPSAAIHEFLSPNLEAAAATTGFMAALAGHLQQQKAGAILWIAPHRNIYPPALDSFGLAPERVIFIRAEGYNNLLWTVEEAVKTDCLSLVISQVAELGFTESRRLQLAVEQSQVTGFIHRLQPRSIQTNACVARWQITPLAAVATGKMPGVGHPRWQVDLQKIRNGKPGSWSVEWNERGFCLAAQQPKTISTMIPKAV